jgi:predicted metal-binding protein
MASGLKRTVRSDWSGAVLVCRKCSKKVGGGFGRKGKTRLAKALRKRLGLKKGRKAAFGVVEVGCLGVCPYGAVTVVDARDTERWRIVPAGSDIDTVVADLRLSEAVAQRA